MASNVHNYNNAMKGPWLSKNLKFLACLIVAWPQLMIVESCFEDLELSFWSRINDWNNHQSNESIRFFSFFRENEQMMA